MEGSLNYQLIGKRLRAIRKKRGYTQEKLSEVANLSPQHLSGVERGRAPVSLSALVGLCRALDATLDEVLYDSVPAAAKPGLMKEVEAVFSDCSADEVYLMLETAKAVKEATRIKGFLKKAD